MYNLLVVLKPVKGCLGMQAELSFDVCSLNIPFINLIETQLSFQAFKNILVKFLSIHFQGINNKVILLKK